MSPYNTDPFLILLLLLPLSPLFMESSGVPGHGLIKKRQGKSQYELMKLSVIYINLGQTNHFTLTYYIHALAQIKNMHSIPCCTARDATIH